ncbi:ABC transporter ATP-binding protein [Hungatella sp.]|uniref:ABC transporter ATP-binding protein n=1 Tax=Hungatella sp. TaxID=2613924 RepID=UPI003AB39AF1
MKHNIKSELYNLKFLAKKVIQASPGYVLAAFVESMLGAALPFVAILFPKYMIDEMMGEKRLSLLVWYVAAAALSALVLSVASGALKRYMNAVTRDILIKIEYDMGSHNMGVAYENLEDTKYIEQKDKAMLPIRERMTHLYIVRQFPELIRCIFTAAGAVGILLSFDVISLVVIMIPTFVIAWLNRGYQKKEMEIHGESVSMERFFIYYYQILEDFGPGKDIRLFHLHELLMKRNNQCDDSIFGFKKQTMELKRGFEGISRVLEALRSAFVYGYIGVKALLTGITIGSFSMYTGAAATFSGSTANLLNIIVRLRQDCRYLEEFVKLEEVPVESEREGFKDIDTDHVTLEFRHVSFRYPGTDRDILTDVNFKLKQGESLSIVGRNGAGKTTVIKLLSRLFKPTGGEILINGTDIHSIDFEVYRKLLSVVFQDFKIFEFSIEENVAAGKEILENRLESALKNAGIYEKIQTLQRGSQTFVGKQFDENGTEFSGGELQKLAIARALYKDSPVIVLDEPTAALDPYAEAEVYERFSELTEGRTTIYISHRLSSCKFCRRIIFLEDGKIVEDGNHEELICLNGKYAEMFQMQASQYTG